MAGSLFALDIHDDLVVGAMVESVAKAFSVTRCGIAEVGDRPLEAAVAEVVEQVGYREGPCHVAFGAEDYFFRNLQFPFADQKKIGKIIPGELLESSCLEADNMVFDYILSQIQGKSSSIVAAMAERSFISDRLEMLRGLSIDPEIFGISGTFGALSQADLAGTAESFLFLDIGFQRAVLIMMTRGRISLVRSLAFDTGSTAGLALMENGKNALSLSPEKLDHVLSTFARSVRQTLLAARIGQLDGDFPVYLAGPAGQTPGLAERLRLELDLDIIHCSLQSRRLLKISDEPLCRNHAGALDRAIAIALCAGKVDQTFNFRKDGFRRKGSVKEIRKYARAALAPLLAVAVACAGLGWYDLARLKKQQAGLEREIRTVFSEALPEVTKIVNPVQQLQVRINEARKTYMTAGTESAGMGMLALLAEISACIPASLQVRIVKLVADQNDVRLKGSTDNFNIVDSIRKELEKSPLFKKVEISSANLSAKDGTVDFELKLDIRR